ncbi:deoxynucleoside kinase [Ruminococcaceae bacterium OttesenSCG-928-L11]|nr:deoxynucleoside kinase [Ruminococcaceae bacterium OttesenSCG-928-L11]
MNSNGTLIVIEGLDGSGKSTQTGLLADWLTAREISVRRLKFPDYDSKSSTLVQMYLNGELGGIQDVNLYAASSFYAADRYISFVTGWRQDYEAGAVMLCDRYTTSNLIYQMAKLPRQEWTSYMDWLWDFEFTRMGLPQPDKVLYLDMQPETSRALLEKRYRENGGQMDIHEESIAYLLQCREAALFAAQRLGWTILRCCDGRQPLPIEAIFQLITDKIKEIIKL